MRTMRQPTVKQLITENKVSAVKPVLIVILTCGFLSLCVVISDLWPANSINGILTPLLFVIVFNAVGLLAFAYARKAILTPAVRTIVDFSCVTLIFVILVSPDMGKNLLPAAGLVASFLLPSFVIKAWENFTSMVVVQRKAWYPDVDADQPVTVSLNRIRLSFRLRRSETDQSETVVPAMVPSRIPLGRSFQIFIDDQTNSNRLPIQTADGQQHAFGWHFYKQSAFGLLMKPLDPYRSSKENGLSANDVVAVRRVRRTFNKPSIKQATPNQAMKKIN
jgi:Type VI secretion system, TssN